MYGNSASFTLPTIHSSRTRSGHEINWVTNGTRLPPILVIGGWLTHVVLDWLNGPCAQFHRRLATRHRLIRFDFPGTGLSPSATPEMDLETAVDAAETVAVASGERGLIVLAYAFSNTVAVGLAARRPDLVRCLVLMGEGPGAGQPERQGGRLLDATAALIQADWRLGASAMAGVVAPQAKERHVTWYANHQQMCASADQAYNLLNSLRRINDAKLIPHPSIKTVWVSHFPAGDRPNQFNTESAAESSHHPAILPVADTVPYFGAADSVLGALELLTTQFPVKLTTREITVLRELRTGHTNRLIARRLEISEHTAAKHIANLFRKLEVNNRCAAVMRAQQLGVLPSDEAATGMHAEHEVGRSRLEVPPHRARRTRSLAWRARGAAQMT